MAIRKASDSGLSGKKYMDASASTNDSGLSGKKYMDASASTNKISDVPDAPTIGTATATGATTATVAYTAATTGGAVTTFTATSTPGSIMATGTSPITVTGLTQNTSYTFKVKGTNATATGTESAASNSVTPA